MMSFIKRFIKIRKKYRAALCHRQYQVERDNLSNLHFILLKPLHLNILLRIQELLLNSRKTYDETIMDHLTEILT